MLVQELDEILNFVSKSALKSKYLIAFSTFNIGINISVVAIFQKKFLTMEMISKDQKRSF